MRVLGAALPGLVGLSLLVVAFQSTVTSLRDNGASAVSAFRGGLLPVAIGVALLLVALAVSRRSRAGYLLGLATAGLGIVAGLAVIVLEMPYIGQGGFGAAIGGGVVIVAAIWVFAWVGYGVWMRRARTSFEATWLPSDRRFAIVLAALALFSTASSVALAAIDAQAAATAVIDEARAQELVDGTSLEVDVVDVAVEPASGATPGAQAVASLTLDITVRSPTAYPLATPPTLCLTDLATYRDPGYKTGIFCWGSPSPSEAFQRAFSDGTVPDVRTVRLVLERGTSPCAFVAGAWSAELGLVPQIDAAGGSGGPVRSTYATATTFQVESATVVPPASSEGSECIASTVSP